MELVLGREEVWNKGVGVCVYEFVCVCLCVCKCVCVGRVAKGESGCWEVGGVGL